MVVSRIFFFSKDVFQTVPLQGHELFTKRQIFKTGPNSKDLQMTKLM